MKIILIFDILWQMGKYGKLLLKILSETSDANIHFDDSCDLLKSYGFEVRVRGSHHMFRKEGVVDKINLQRDGNKTELRGHHA